MMIAGNHYFTLVVWFDIRHKKEEIVYAPLLHHACVLTNHNIHLSTSLDKLQLNKTEKRIDISITKCIPFEINKFLFIPLYSFITGQGVDSVKY